MKRTKIFAVHRGRVPNFERGLVEYKRVKHLKHLSMNAYLNILLEESLKRQEFRLRYAPAYKVIGLIDNVLHIRNHETNTIFQIVKRGDELFCIEDESTNCKHIMFAVSTDEVSELYESAVTQLIIDESKRVGIGADQIPNRSAND